MEFFVIVFGFGAVIALGVTAIEAWAKVAQARARGSSAEMTERMAKLEAELEAIKDQVAELMIESSDRDRLRAEDSTLTRPARLKAE